MRSYPWFRLFSEARTDAKLRTLSDAEHRVWFGLLCMAAEQPQRGTITGRTDAVLALEVSSGDVALLRQTVTRLVQLQILSDGGADGITFVHFRDRQHDYPSDLPEATRARKQAQRSRVVTSVSRDVTSGHEGEEKRREKKREEEKKDHDRSEGGESERGDVNSSAPPKTPRRATPSTKTVVVELTPGQRERLRQDFAALGEGFDDYLGEALSYYTPLIIKGKHSNLYACARKSLRAALDRRTNGQHPNPAHRTTSHPASATELAGWSRKTSEAPS